MSHVLITKCDATHFRDAVVRQLTRYELNAAAARGADRLDAVEGPRVFRSHRMLGIQQRQLCERRVGASAMPRGRKRNARWNETHPTSLVVAPIERSRWGPRRRCLCGSRRVTLGSLCRRVYLILKRASFCIIGQSAHELRSKRALERLCS